MYIIFMLSKLSGGELFVNTILQAVGLSVNIRNTSRDKRNVHKMVLTVGIERKL